MIQRRAWLTCTILNNTVTFLLGQLQIVDKTSPKQLFKSYFDTRQSSNSYFRISTIKLKLSKRKQQKSDDALVCKF